MNLPNRDQVGHAVKIVGSKFAVTSCFNLPPSLADLSSQFVLNVTVLGQLPESKGRLEFGRPSRDISLVWELTAFAVVS
jgi:hypothetical protein